MVVLRSFALLFSCCCFANMASAGTLEARSLSQINVASSVGFDATISDDSTAGQNYDLDTYSTSSSLYRAPDPVMVNYNRGSQSFTLHPAGFTWTGEVHAESNTNPWGRTGQYGGSDASFDLEVVVPDSSEFLLLLTTEIAPLPGTNAARDVAVSLEIYDQQSASVWRFQPPLNHSTDFGVQTVNLAAGLYHIRGEARAYLWPNTDVDFAHAYEEVSMIALPEPSTFLLASLALLGGFASSGATIAPYLTRNPSRGKSLHAKWSTPSACWPGHRP